MTSSKLTEKTNRNIRRSSGFDDSELTGCFMVLNRDAAIAIASKLTGSQIRLWFYLSMIDAVPGSVIDEEKIAQSIGASKRQVSRSLKELSELNLLPEWVVLSNTDRNNIEFQVRDRLRAQIGGLSEVKTPSGRIDLLTEAQIIEVKRVSEWKSALGQILVYSAFYPEHQKRLHLFGSSNEEKQITDIASTCLSFGVFVTFEAI